jgi:hypothetical protein
MIFQRLLLLSINKDAVQRRKHPARPHAYDHSKHKPWCLYICSHWNRYSASTPNASTVFVVTVKSFRRRRAYSEVGAAGRSTPVLVSDRAWSCQWRRWIKAFLRSLPPNRKAAARVGHHPLHCGIAWPAVVGMRRQWTGRGFSFHPSATGHGIVALGRLRHFFVSCHSDPTVVRSQVRAPVSF